MNDCKECDSGVLQYYPTRGEAKYFQCEDCGSCFEIEADADWNGDHYIDCSTAGKKIPTPEDNTWYPPETPEQRWEREIREDKDLDRIR